MVLKMKMEPGVARSTLLSWIAVLTDMEVYSLILFVSLRQIKIFFLNNLDMEWITDIFLPFGFVAVGQDIRGTEKSGGTIFYILYLLFFEVNQNN